MEQHKTLLQIHLTFITPLANQSIVAKTQIFHLAMNELQNKYLPQKAGAISYEYLLEIAAIPTVEQVLLAIIRVGVVRRWS